MADTILDHLTLLAPTILKIMTFFTGVLKNMGHKLSDEPWADLLGSKLSDWQPLEIFFGVDTKNSKKTAFFAKIPSPQHFYEGKFFRDRTM